MKFIKKIENISNFAHSNCHQNKSAFLHSALNCSCGKCKNGKGFQENKIRACVVSFGTCTFIVMVRHLNNINSEEIINCLAATLTSLKMSSLHQSFINLIVWNLFFLCNKHTSYHCKYIFSIFWFNKYFFYLTIASLFLLINC